MAGALGLATLSWMERGLVTELEDARARLGALAAERAPDPGEVARALEATVTAVNLAAQGDRRGTLGARTVALEAALDLAHHAAGVTDWPDRLRLLLADALVEQGRSAEAERYLVARLHRAEDGRGDLAIAGALYELARHRVRFRGDAEPLVERLRGLCARSPEIQRQYELLATDLAADLARTAGDAAAIERALLGHIDAMRRRVGPGHVDYAITIGQLGSFQKEQGALEAAARTFETALGIALPRSPETAGWFLLPLAELALDRDRPAEARAHFEKLERAWKWKHDAPRERIAALRARLSISSRPPPRSTPAPDGRAPERLRHPKLGIGVVVHRDGPKVRLRMEDGAERTFLADRLEPAT